LWKNRCGIVFFRKFIHVKKVVAFIRKNPFNKNDKIADGITVGNKECQLYLKGSFIVGTNI